MISVWSALDDFCVGIEAEVARWESFAKVELIKHDTETEATQSRLEILLTRFGWRQPQQKSLLIVLRYFGAVRNCIAHRDSKASPALAALSASSELSEAYFSLSDSPQRTLPVFEPDVEILVHPKLALVYSHLGRLLAMQVNEVLVNILGVDGILNMAVAHVSTTERRAVSPPKTAEAILNCLLIDRYLVRLENKLEAPKRLRDLKLWDRFLLSA